MMMIDMYLFIAWHKQFLWKNRLDTTFCFSVHYVNFCCFANIISIIWKKYTELLLLYNNNNINLFFLIFTLYIVYKYFVLKRNKAHLLYLKSTVFILYRQHFVKWEDRSNAIIKYVFVESNSLIKQQLNIICYTKNYFKYTTFSE